MFAPHSTYNFCDFSCPQRDPPGGSAEITEDSAQVVVTGDLIPMEADQNCLYQAFADHEQSAQDNPNLVSKLAGKLTGEDWLEHSIAVHSDLKESSLARYRVPHARYRVPHAR